MQRSGYIVSRRRLCPITFVCGRGSTVIVERLESARPWEASQACQEAQEARQMADARAVELAEASGIGRTSGRPSWCRSETRWRARWRRDGPSWRLGRRVGLLAVRCGRLGTLII
jgi:hypothetical protein